MILQPSSRTTTTTTPPTITLFDDKANQTTKNQRFWGGSTTTTSSTWDDKGVENDKNNELGSFQNLGEAEKTSPTLESPTSASSATKPSSSSSSSCSSSTSTPWAIQGRKVRGYALSQTPQSPQRRRGGGVFVAWYLDVPLVFLVTTWMVTTWMQYVYQTYWDGQFQTMVASTASPRSVTDWTYYNRECSTTQVSTANVTHLVLPSPSQRATLSRQDNYDDSPYSVHDSDYYVRHHLHHGFSMVQATMSAETMAQLRHYIIQRNLETGKDYFVLQNKDRYSFGLDPNHHPIVAQALQELTRPNGQLSEVVEQIIGPDPALIELTAITSTHGAKAQHYHSDVVGRLSSLRYGRTFTPLWSIFLQLQNTTVAMGATRICPGVQVALDGSCADICDEQGYPLVDPVTGYWAAGDAVLMNMNSYHHGAAHTDPTPGSERVMLILTLGPRPRPRAESRQISQGATLSLRHDLWGHTWRDMQQAEKVMKKPFSVLRSYGLYHTTMLMQPQIGSPNNWGYDYISNIYMRIANDPSFFNPNDFEVKHNKVFAWILPTFLHPTLSEEEASNDNCWYHFLKALLQRVYIFQTQVVVLAVCAYLILYTLEGWLPTTTKKKYKNHRSTIIIPIPEEDGTATTSPSVLGGLKGALMRLFQLALFVYGGLAWARHVTNSTRWAQDSRQGRLYHSVTQYESKFADIRRDGWTTFPTQYDVLLEHRLGGSHYLGCMKDFIHKGHYGNVRLQEIVSSFANPPKDKNHQVGSSVVEFAKDVVIRSIWDTLRFPSEESEGAARFLEQGIKGRWYLTSQEKAYNVIEMALLGQVQFPILGILSRETLLPMITEWRYGIYQSTALASKHGVPVLQAFERQLYQQAAVAAAAAAITGTTTGTTTTGQTFGQRTRSLARPVSFQTAVSMDESTLVVTPSPSLSLLTTSDSTASSASSGVPFWPRLSLLPQIPRLSAPRGTWTQRCRLAVTSGSSSAQPPLRTLPRSLVVTPPLSGAWIHSGSWVYIKRDGFWYPGRVVHVLPNQRTRIQSIHGKSWHYIYSVLPLNPLDLVGQYVELRLSKSRFETCRVIHVHDGMDKDERPKNNNNNNNLQIQTKPVLHTVLLDLEFEDGKVLEGVDILLVRVEAESDGEEEDGQEDENDGEGYSTNNPESPYSVSEDE